MTKTENKREEKKRKVIMPAGIRNKLVAAISMLMVASIMMVSSTYAWFTLSTAPEVKGITTNVGANGNLEMMLLNKASFTSAEENLGVESDINDSMAVANVTAANLKWGNLVDLADQSYGLQSIVINPSRLNISQVQGENSYTLGSTLLKAPTYTSDGRVLDVDKDTLTSGYSTDKTWKWDESAENAYGVRVIGTTSGVTERLTAYRAAISERTAQIEAAKNYARQSLLKEGQGQALADIIVKAALGQDAKFTVEDLNTLMNLIDLLEQSNDAAGEAIVQTVLAYNLGASNADADFTDADVAPLKEAFENATAGTLPTSFTSAEGSSYSGTINKPEGTDAAVSKWTDNNSKISKAKNDLQTKIDEGEESYTADDITDIVNSLINKQYATVAGVTNPTKNDASTIVDYLSTHNMILDIQMNQGSGVYADIAELVGDYTAAGLKVHVEYGVLKTDVTTNMSTKVETEGNTTLPMIPKLAVGDAPDATADPSTKPLLTDHFGYALDFGFRTNAATSNLLLQTEGIQRVYNGADYTDVTADSAPKTQGGGSYMQFTTNNTTTFSVDELRALMSALRVVFVEPVIGNDDAVTYNVLGVAAANITANTDNDGITSYTGGTLLKDGTALAEGTTTGANGVKVELNLYNYTVDATTGVITLGLKKGLTKGEDGAVSGTEDNTLTALTQNVAKKVTAIVYLDGDIVDNTMVANARNSMTGMLNLQFASSATLKPMDNTGMRNGGTTGTETTVTYTKEKDAGASYTQVIGGTEYTIKVNDGYTIYKGSDDNYYYVYNDNGNYVQFTEAGISSCPAFTITAKTGG